MIKKLGFLIVLTLVISSCSGISQKSIDEKIEKEGIDANFSQKEYAFMADYAISHFEDSKSSDYIFVLLNASVEGKLDASNEAKCEELQTKVKQHQFNF